MKITHLFHHKPTLIELSEKEARDLHEMIYFITLPEIMAKFSDYYLKSGKDERIYDRNHWKEFLYALFKATGQSQ